MMAWHQAPTRLEMRMDHRNLATMPLRRVWTQPFSFSTDRSSWEMMEWPTEVAGIWDTFSSTFSDSPHPDANQDPEPGTWGSQMTSDGPAGIHMSVET